MSTSDPPSDVPDAPLGSAAGGTAADGVPPGRSDADGSAAPPPPPPKAGRHSRWLWVSLVLGAVVVGLLVWGLAKNADLNDAQDQLDQQSTTASAVSTTAKSAFEDVTQDLASTNQELDATKQDVKDAEAAAGQAQQQADKAKDQAAQSSDETAKAKAKAKEAQAEADAATSKANVVTECAKAYVSAAGSIFDGDDIKAQAEAAKQQLADISAECKAAFAGS